jgi:hypothetical protein
MPRFVLLDNSLAPAGGHHFEFADAILREAERAGYSPVIGANVELAESAEVAQRWPTHRVFPSSIYHDYNLFYLSRWDEREATKKAVALPGPLRHVSDFYNAIRTRLRRRRWVVKRNARGEGFVDGCRALFQQVQLEPGDIVMLPTVSDVELEMLAAYFREDRRTAVAEWHLYFHNNFLIGRPPEYDAQDFRLATMRQSLQACLEAGSGYKLRFYTTTPELADQFQRMGLGVTFQRLSFPVREVLRAIAPENGAGPKRVVCAGGFRDERGQFALPEIVRAVWDDLLKPGQAQIHVQRDKPEWQVPLPEAAESCAPPQQPVVYHPHPLSTEAYNDLIRRADVGLLLHDAHSYYARLSAVFQEYVCAGIPVIVPAGCWLGDQIAEENSRYVERVVRERQAQMTAHETIEWTAGGSVLAALARGRFSFRGPQSPLVGKATAPHGATDLVVQCRWQAPEDNGQFVRIALEQQSGTGNWRREAEAVAGRRVDGRELAVMFHVPKCASQVRIVLENAFASGTIAVTEPRVTFLAAPEPGEMGLPSGNSGLSFARRSEIPRLLREMIAHYPHYRQRAQEKSAEWRDQLTPAATWAQLRAGGAAEKTCESQRSRAA